MLLWNARGNPGPADPPPPRFRTPETRRRIPKPTAGRRTSVVRGTSVFSVSCRMAMAKA